MIYLCIFANSRHLNPYKHWFIHWSKIWISFPFTFLLFMQKAAAQNSRNSWMWAKQKCFSSLLVCTYEAVVLLRCFLLFHGFTCFRSFPRIQVHPAPGQPAGCLWLAEPSSGPSLPPAERQRTLGQWAVWTPPPGPLWAPVQPRDRWNEHHSTGLYWECCRGNRSINVINIVPHLYSTVKGGRFFCSCLACVR